jgi:hypothetical protein
MDESKQVMSFLSDLSSTLFYCPLYKYLLHISFCMLIEDVTLYSYFFINFFINFLRYF